MENVSDLKNNGTGSKRRRLCENDEQVLFDNMKELNIAIHEKVKIDNPELSENHSKKYCSADTPLHEALEKSNKSFKNECNIGKDSKKENKLKLSKGGRNSISSMPHKEAVKTNGRKLSLNLSSQDLKENYDYSKDISPINKNNKNQNLKDKVITRSMLKYSSPQSSNDEKLCRIRDNISCSNDQSSSEQDSEKSRYHSNFPVDLATMDKLKKNNFAHNFEMYCLEDSSTNSSEESNVSVKENVRMSSQNTNLKNSPHSKASYSENETISPSSNTSNQNSYSEEYDQNEEISEDSFNERKVNTRVSKKFAPIEKSKSSKYNKLNSKVAKLASLDLLNEEQQNLVSDDHEESLKLDDSPKPVKSVRRKSQRIGKENRDSKTKDKTVNARSRKSISLSESEEIFDSPEQVKSDRKKSKNRKSKNDETSKANIKKVSTISRATPKRLSLALETYMQDKWKPELGLSWDKNCTPPRRFSLRLKKEPGSDTPISNKSYLSLGNTPRYLMRKRYTGTSTDSEENTKIKSESKKLKVKKINLNNSDGAFETDSDVEMIKPKVSTKNPRITH